MNRMQITCGNCDGIGYEIFWKVVVEDKKTHTGTMESEKVICKNCNGKGWTEYAVFSVEEAEAILKHCGLKEE